MIDIADATRWPYLFQTVRAQQRPSLNIATDVRLALISYPVTGSPELPIVAIKVRTRRTVLLPMTHDGNEHRLLFVECSKTCAS